MKVTKEREKECLKWLRDMIKPGAVVYTQVVHVSRSGMYRVIRLFIIEDNEPKDISHLAADLLEGYDKRHEGCRASGYGMDMGFHLVSNLGLALFPVGFGCIGKKCPSNDHLNRDRDYTPNVNEGITSDKKGNQRVVNTHWHNSGCYAIKHRQL